MRKAILTGLVVTMVLVLGVPWRVPAQGDARAKVLGVWKGTLSYAATAPTVVEFFEDQGVLKWKCSFATSSRIIWGEAEGTVTDLSLPKLQATGVYTKHSQPGVEGTTLTLVLTVNGNSMTGTATSDLTKIPIDVSLSRAP